MVRRAWLGLAVAAVLVGGTAWGAGVDWLAGFREPPATARPWVYWFVMDGNLTREGITADLEAMAKAGLGGALFLEVDVGVPRGETQFMGSAWRVLFAHAVREAERLGLELTLNAGPGWTGSGGPWVAPEQSMQHLVASATEVTGPGRVDVVLPRPAPHPRFFPGELPRQQERAMAEFYADVAVLAFPTPAAGGALTDVEEKALYVRAPYSSQPGVKPYLPTPATYPSLPAGAAIDPRQVLDLSDRLDPEGRLLWDAPAGAWTLLRCGRRSTGANTRPAPLPGLGLECDKLDQAALDAHFESFVGSLLREIGPRPWRRTAGWTYLHIDSWEMGAQNWTARFRDEFRKRRGYDPLPYLPAYTGRAVGSLELSERFLWDVRCTAQDLVLVNHAEHLRSLGRRHGFGLSIEPYDMNPCADLALGGMADVPMCEFWSRGYGFDTAYSVVEASSVAHTLDRPVVAAEAFTADANEAWQLYPGLLKAQGDWALCAGVNRFVVHRWAHQPWLDRRPGMTMGPYGVHWERTQTWWGMVPAYHRYLARCQYLLRQGHTVADIAYLAPEDAPHVFRPPPSALSGPLPDRRGYSFDGCDPGVLLEKSRVRDGSLLLASPNLYRVLVLPEVPTMTPPLLRRVRDLVKAGATVVGAPPTRAPGLYDYPQCDRDVRRLAAELWGRCDGVTVTEHAFGKGRVVWRRRAVADDEAVPPVARLGEARWIWYPEGQPAAQAPVGTCRFRRSFALEPGRTVTAATLSLTVDNEFEVLVNGHPVGSGDNFHVVSTFAVQEWLTAGPNMVTVNAVNGGSGPNPAALIARLRVRFADGPDLDVVSDRQWECSRAAADPGEWVAALELGPAGMGPWNLGSRADTPPPSLYPPYEQTAGLLARTGLPPDFESDGPLRYTHRRDGQADLYFVANREDRAVTATATFRVAGRQPELWDPLTGQARDLGRCEVRNGRTSVPLGFAPYQSLFVIFRRPLPRPTQPPVAPAAAAAPIAPRELAGPWEVSFDPAWGGPPAPVRFERLEDWRTRPEDGIRYYSGVAVYRTAFYLTEADSGLRLCLDLGSVPGLARVRLNGQDLGVAWCAPWLVDVSTALQSGANRLEIEVANTWANRLIGDQRLPPEQRLTRTTWNPYQAASPLAPSGLLGPVRLLSPAPAPDQVAVEGPAPAPAPPPPGR